MSVTAKGRLTMELPTSLVPDTPATEWPLGRELTSRPGGVDSEGVALIMLSGTAIPPGSVTEPRDTWWEQSEVKDAILKDDASWC